jgi:hypothetical protein
MKTIGFREHYDRDGFVLVPSVLSPQEVAEHRRVIDSEFEKNGGDYLTTSQCLEVSKLYNLLFLEPIVRVLKEILQPDFTLYPNFNVQKNSFSLLGVLHRDIDSEGKPPYAFQPDYRFVKCGIYLQDNDPEWGGGINVTPRGHRFRRITGSPKWDFRAFRIRDTVRMKMRERRVNSKAGDAIIFDSRLPHSSTMASRYRWEDCDYGRLRIMPPEHTKYVVYWDASNTASYVRDFMLNSARRAVTEFFFSNYVRLRFPESFPADFVAAVRKSGIHVAQLDREKALFWEEAYQKSLSTVALQASS